MGGVLLCKRAGEILDLVEKTKSEFHDSNGDITGTTYIVAGETDAMRYLAKATRMAEEVNVTP